MRLLYVLVFAAMAIAGEVHLTYLGTAGWEITDGKTIILVDPYFTRAKYNSPNDAVAPDDPRPLVTVNTMVEPDAAVIDAHVRKADYILITHGHPDHALDMPYIARKTGATVIGTASTANLARASGVDAAHVKAVKGGDRVELASDVSVRAIASLHGIFRRPREGAPPAPPPPQLPADAKPPFRFGQFVEGGTLAYLISIGGHQIILFGSMNYIEREIEGLRPDIALIGAMPERHNIDDYTSRLMRALGSPPVVLPTHWDRFNVPHAVSQAPAVERLQSFIAEINVASPKTKVIVPEYFKPVSFNQ
jgi:L-ascorbate metabolism protein UlaG (beta-lactamase superfamily)